MTDSCCPLILSGGGRGSACHTAGRRELAADKHFGEKKIIVVIIFFLQRRTSFQSPASPLSNGGGRSGPELHTESEAPVKARDSLAALSSLVATATSPADG